MLTIETKELKRSKELKRKIKMICKFANVKYKFTNGNIKSIKNEYCLCKAICMKN